MTTRVASCRCGQLKVTCTGDPIRAAICHCFNCQKRTGSIFGVQARFLAEQTHMEGESKIYLNIGDEGSRAEMNFCPTCGSTVYWKLLDGNEPSKFVIVAVGAFADPNFPAPKFTVYNARRHLWAAMPDLKAENWD